VLNARRRAQVDLFRKSGLCGPSQICLGWCCWGFHRLGSAFHLRAGSSRRSMGTAFTAIADDGSALITIRRSIAFQGGTRNADGGRLRRGIISLLPTSTPVGAQVPRTATAVGEASLILSPPLYTTKQLSPRLTFGFGLTFPLDWRRISPIQRWRSGVHQVLGRFAGPAPRFNPTGFSRL